MRSKIVTVGIVVSCLLAACSSSTPTPTAVPPQPQPTQPGYPVLFPTIPPTGYPGSPAPAASIIYKDFEIQPAELSVVAGTPVQFMIDGNASATHQPYSDSAPNAFEAPTELKRNETYAFTFTQPGTVILLCKVHLEMRATLTVLQP